MPLTWNQVRLFSTKNSAEVSSWWLKPPKPEMISRPALENPTPDTPGSRRTGVTVSRALPSYFLRLFLSGTPANELMDTWLFFLTVLALALFLYDLLLLEDLLFL